MQRRVLLSALVAASLAGLVGGPGAWAQGSESGGVDVRPAPGSPHASPAGGFLELGVVSPGQPVSDAVLVRSTFDEQRDVHLYAADALPAAGGGFGFRAREEADDHAGAWIDLPTERLTLPAGGEVRVPLTVVVPAGVPGGEYVAGVVAEPAGQDTGAGVSTVTRFAMAVYLEVEGGPGQTPGRGRADGALVVETVEPRLEDGRACPRLTYRNESQRIVDPAVTVRTEGPMGPGASYNRDRVGALLPEASATVQLPCLDRPFGPGRLVVEVDAPTGSSTEEHDYVWLPWPFVLAVTALLLLALALLSLLLRGRRRPSGGSGRRPDARRPGPE